MLQILIFIKNHLCLVFRPNKILGINFLVKFIYFDPLLSPCAWLVKWHKYIIAIFDIMGITERVLTVLAVLILLLLSYPWYMWHWLFETVISRTVLQLLFYVNLNKLIMSNGKSCHIVCTTGSGHMRTCEEHKHDTYLTLTCIVLAITSEW